MELVKTSTEHLVSYKTQSLLGQPHYQIYEVDKNEEHGDKPIVIYISRDDIRQSEDLPEDLTKYKYFDELAEIVEELMSMEIINNGGFDYDED